MKKYIGKCVLAAAMVLAMSGAAQAKDDDDNDDGKGCSESTLRGLYVFTASGFNIVGGVAQPKAIVELIRFDGHGNLTVPEVTRSINGVIGSTFPPNPAIPPNGTGTYSVGSDCTGSLVFAPSGPNFDLFIGFKASEVHMIQTNSGTVFQGTAERLSH
jgi:hypothetical protein